MFQPVLTDHTDCEVFLDLVGERHEMRGTQRDGPLVRDWDQAVVVETEAHLLSQQAT